MIEESPFEQARKRVNNNETLTAYTDLLLEDDWGIGDEHFHWVATADEMEILEWAATVRAGQESES